MSSTQQKRTSCPNWSWNQPLPPTLPLSLEASASDPIWFLTVRLPAVSWETGTRVRTQLSKSYLPQSVLQGSQLGLSPRGLQASALSTCSITHLTSCILTTSPRRRRKSIPRDPGKGEWTFIPLVTMAVVGLEGWTQCHHVIFPQPSG